MTILLELLYLALCAVLSKRGCNSLGGSRLALDEEVNTIGAADGKNAMQNPCEGPTCKQGATSNTAPQFPDRRRDLEWMFGNILKHYDKGEIERAKVQAQWVGNFLRQVQLDSLADKEGVVG